ncbi:phosphotransferase family protein [Wenzhouxiangella marina]|uniref:Aminoglycoside phosphotransferase n=1 Tax=Wenzhouxiangella marina TaxID=1579979 RepID=A0A0K0XX77_9GAMM|nr:phosphotransferase family protein [Wenzhouxiangella marina]AKS42285.1 Aminoglycoside phosphotransferase [Wenzhouxiangella marina]MBB6085942.1 aminoglycoside phosphotransferase (APT) family kinase protein [Wenzhouxiangella marina]
MSSKSLIDQPRHLRDEDRFDVQAVDAWLKARVAGLEGTPEVEQFSKGASNLTYRLRYADRDLILRRPPPGTKAKSAHNMVREHDVQKALKPVYPKVPAMVALCTDDSVIGCDFYVMERIEGIILRANLPPGLELSTEQAATLCRRAIDGLIELHSVDVEAAGLASLGKGEGYNRRQIDGWSERFRRARTWNVFKGEKVMRWLDANVPEEVGIRVIHGDYRFDNIVLSAEDPLEIIGVLDWELATLGDPLMDLGNSLAYWVQADDDRFLKGFRRQPTHIPGMMTRREVVDYYCDRMGFRPDNWAFYEVYGLFRLAAIVQQIYYRYHHGQTRNPAFKGFWKAANYLLWRCGRIIKRQ